jgi:hypothetical protein
MKHWTDFSKTANLTEEHTGKTPPSTNPTPTDLTPPYVLVYSHSQENFNRTGDLPKQVDTEFKNASFADMYVAVESIVEDKDRKNTNGIIPSFFMVLDKQSATDRKVVLIDKGLRCFYVNEDEEYKVCDHSNDDILWRKHRIPFEKVCFFWLVLEAKPGMEGDEFLEKTARGSADELD